MVKLKFFLEIVPFWDTILNNQRIEIILHKISGTQVCCRAVALKQLVSHVERKKEIEGKRYKLDLFLLVTHD